MAKNLSLEEQFPEFTQSVLEDIRKQNGGNFLEMMKQDTEKLKKTKIDEVEANFPTFDRKVVEETLASNDWDVPRAIFALIQLQEKSEKEKKGDEHKKVQEERLRKQREESKQFLLKMFDNLSPEVIQKVLDDNEGDVDIATTQLIDLVENQQKEKRVEQERELTINTIFDKFSENITRDEVVQAFHQQHFDVKQTTVELLKISEKRKIQRLQLVFKNVTESTIERTLVKADWVLKEAMKLLLEENYRQQTLKEAEAKRKEEEAKREKLRKEEEERIRREEEKIKETKKREQEEERKRKEEEERKKKELAELKAKAESLREEQRKREIERQEEELRKNEEERKEQEGKEEIRRREEERKLQEEIERRRKQLEEERRKEGEERKRREEEERRSREEEEQRKREEEVLAKRNFLDRSVYATKEVLERLDENKKKESFDLEKVKLLVKEELEQKLRGGVEGLPGYQEAEANAENGERGREKEKESPVSSAPTQETKKDAPFASTEVVSAPKGLQMTLRASPAEVEGGNTITVEWEVESSCTSFVPSSSDWVAMYLQSASFKNYEAWEWVSATTKKGSLQFKAPYKHGSLHFRYYTQKSFALCATSNQIQLGPRFNLAVSEPIKTDQGAAKVELAVSQIFGSEYSKAWAGLYQKKATREKDSNYHTWSWLSSGRRSPSAPGAQLLPFEIPKAGQWEFRLFLDRLPFFGEETSLAVASASVLVEGNDKLNLTVQESQNLITIEYDIRSVDPKNEAVWIGVYHSNQVDNRQYRRYKYVTDNKGAITFKKLQHTGVYEARLFASKSFDSVISKSNSVEIICQ